MERIRSVQVPSFVGQRVKIAGWLAAIRQLSRVDFLVVRDGWGIVQAVANERAMSALRGAQPESVVVIEGEVQSSPKAPGGFELHEIDVEIVSKVDRPLPILLSKREVEAQLGNLLEHAPLTHRHPKRRAVFRIAAAAMRAFRSALDARGFVEIASPKLVESATESGANVFELDYFGRPAYLAQSPQLYKQIMVGVFERVYEVGPVFRAEPHDTVRHLNQYTSLDVELGFIESHHDVMRLLVEVLRAMSSAIESECGPELALLGARLPILPATVPEIHFAETPQPNEPDLAPEMERRLGREALERHGSDFLFVTGYPMAKRPFYTHPDPARPGHSKSFDLLFRGTELVTGGQRLHRYEDYVAALDLLTARPPAALRASEHPAGSLNQRGMNSETLRAAFSGYLEAFEFGMPPHGGFAIGLERFLMQLLDLPNVRLAALFPRDLGRLRP